MDVLGLEQQTRDQVIQDAFGAIDAQHMAQQVAETEASEHARRGLLKRISEYGTRLGATALTTVAFLGVPAAAGANREGITSHASQAITAAHDLGRKSPSEKTCITEALKRPLNISLVDGNKAKVTQVLSFTSKAMRKGCKNKRGMQAFIQTRKTPEDQYSNEGETRKFFSNKRFSFSVHGNLGFRKCGQVGYDRHNVLIRAAVRESYPDPVTHTRVSRTHYTKPRNLCAGK